MIKLKRKNNEKMELNNILEYIDKFKTKDILTDSNEKIKNEIDEIIGTRYTTKSVCGIENIFEIIREKDFLRLTHIYINPNQSIDDDDDDILD